MARSAAQAALVAALAAMLAGCHMTRVVWAKPDADNAALQRDLQDCAFWAEAAAPISSDTVTPTGAGRRAANREPAGQLHDQARLATDAAAVI
ncbi:MAG: hypothetical protein KGL11_05260 [Alphaproteobacteria bacterium]|nr:hypothetical protein [Alphaproteobacteria bacterium]